jgi:hypothetical protein
MRALEAALLVCVVHSWQPRQHSGVCRNPHAFSTKKLPPTHGTGAGLWDCMGSSSSVDLDLPPLLIAASNGRTNLPSPYIIAFGFIVVALAVGAQQMSLGNVFGSEGNLGGIGKVISRQKCSLVYDAGSLFFKWE